MKMNTQIKIKHHYIPKFHLKNWQDHNGLLLVYKKIGDGSILCKEKHPSQVCFEKGLYSLGSDLLGIKALAPDYIENELSIIDTAASVVMEKIISNSSLLKLTDEDKNNWAMYVYSLMNRIPERVKESEKLAKKIFKEILDEINTNGVAELQETYEQCTQLIENSDYLKNQARLMLLSSTKKSEEVNALTSFSWQLFHISNELPYRFILTENPMVTFGENSRISVILLALTPNILWAALPKHIVNSTDFADLVKHLVLIYNCAQIAKKSEFIISSIELKNDGLHRYDKIFSEFVKLTVGPNAKT
jgi:hypothetical protein